MTTTDQRTAARPAPAASDSDASDMITVDGNEACASVAYRLNEIMTIYPITPSSSMGELADDWATRGRTNLWGDVPQVVEMQSEGGAAGALHGALQAGCLSTTFTASQGLLLMLPNLYKIAGELTSLCLHVAARTVATHALSIFGDHSDVMACRQTGFALLASASVQEAQDMACVGQAAALATRVPVLHFFDGFRTSHEVAKIHPLGDEQLRAMIDDELVRAHRARRLTPDAPVLRGTAQNPDTFFQAREAANRHYDACPAEVHALLERFERVTGRRYRLFEYSGHPEARHVVVLMGSGTQTAEETAEQLVQAHGERVGVLKVRLFRPFSVEHFAEALPPTVERLAVLDRTKEPGSVGEPLFLDVLAALHEARARGGSPLEADPLVIGGRYGLSSKEFTPAMVKAVFDELARPAPRRRFTVGIHDDVTHLSLPVDTEFRLPAEGVFEALFYGLGSDGTVGANKNTIKIIGAETDQHAQGYFVYDSKKSGAVTVSHLRFGSRPLRAAHLIQRAGFVACHQWRFLERHDVLAHAAHGATFLLNAPYGPGEVWGHLPREVQETILEKRLELHVVDAYAVADEAGLGRRINTIMQTCFFALAGVLPRDAAIASIKRAIEKTYGKQGAEVVRRNGEAVDRTLARLHRVELPAAAAAGAPRPPTVPEQAPDFVQRVTATMMRGQGDLLPVSAFPVDGTWPTGTARWEKRDIAAEIPIWDPSVCIQCNKCALVCPHAAIRAGVFDAEHLERAPAGFRADDSRVPELRGSKYTIQVAPEDCTGCHLCVTVCPAKDKASPRRKAINMEPHDDHLERERENFDFFRALPPVERSRVERLDVRGTQLLEPLFEFSGACAGCGETPYVKLLTQLFGERLLIANATGCSSIYGGNLPTTPYSMDAAGRGPAWSNSLFEDNAEFGLGFRLAVDQLSGRARALLDRLAPQLGPDVVDALRGGARGVDQGARFAAVDRLRAALDALDGTRRADGDGADARAMRELRELAGDLVDKSVWLLGGDGWAYDIGYGGLDHVLASGRDVNVLVLDTEVYSNTGGQQSKATPLGASAKFAIAGKDVHKKDLGLMAMSYGHVYVASVAMGANDNHTVKALLEAEAYPGPSLVIAYSHCIAHGYDLRYGMDQQKRAADCGVWPLYRFDPRRARRGEPPLHLDAKRLSGSVRDYMSRETRFRMVEKIDRQRFRSLARRAQEQTTRRIAVYDQLARLHVDVAPDGAAGERADAAPPGDADDSTPQRDEES